MGPEIPGTRNAKPAYPRGCAVAPGDGFGKPPSMLRPRKKYTVADLRQLKGKRTLVHVHVKSPEEAAAADAAGVDIMSCSSDSPESQARLPMLVAAAPAASRPWPARGSPSSGTWE